MRSGDENKRGIKMPRKISIVRFKRKRFGPDPRISIATVCRNGVTNRAGGSHVGSKPGQDVQVENNIYFEL